MSVESSIASDSLIPENGADAYSETGENKILLAIQERIPDVRNEEMDVIKGYQKEIRRKITESSKALDRCRGDVSEMIRGIASGKTYADDYFKKTFDSLLSQTSVHLQNSDHLQKSTLQESAHPHIPPRLPPAKLSVYFSPEADSISSDVP